MPSMKPLPGEPVHQDKRLNWAHKVGATCSLVLIGTCTSVFSSSSHSDFLKVFPQMLLMDCMHHCPECILQHPDYAIFTLSITRSGCCAMPTRITHTELD